MKLTVYKFTLFSTREYMVVLIVTSIYNDGWHSSLELHVINGY